MTIVTETRRETIERLLRQGLSQTAIGQQLGISRQRIHQIAHHDPYRFDYCACGARKSKTARRCHNCRIAGHWVKVICAECRTEFPMTRSRAAQSKRHFCKDCRGTLTAKHRYVPRQGKCPACGYIDQIAKFRLGKISRDGGSESGLGEGSESRGAADQREGADSRDEC